MKYNMVKEEKQAAAEAFEKRLNTMIREFVKAFKSMGDLTNNMKEYMTREVDIRDVIIEGKDKVIRRLDGEAGEYKLALRIPRQHYKFIEKLKFEELMEQRDAIIKKMQRKYGIDPTKAMSMLTMPDPSLPPEQ